MSGRFGFKRLILALAITILLGLIWLVPFRLGDFYHYQDEYAGSVLRGDTLTARENLEKLDYFYSWNGVLDNFWLDGLANKYLFYNAPYYRSAPDYLTGNYPTGNYARVLKDLENDNSFWASYLKGNVKWRLAQAMYKHALEMKNKKEAAGVKKEAEELAYSTKSDYEVAVKSDPWKTLPSSWNYDLTTDREALLRSLLPKPLKVRIPLGVPPTGVPSTKEKKPSGSSEDLDKKEGLPQPKRGG